MDLGQALASIVVFLAQISSQHQNNQLVLFPPSVNSLRFLTYFKPDDFPTIFTLDLEHAIPKIIHSYNVTEIGKET